MKPACEHAKRGQEGAERGEPEENPPAPSRALLFER
jgi:hypothetical protein